MSRAFSLVTGATGLIGHGIAQALVARGVPTRVLVRDVERARRTLPGAVELVLGDITEPETLAPAVRGAEVVYHAAGMPEQWQRDETVFDRVNREGTRNVLEASLAAGVRRVVYTSTMDVFAAPPGGTLRETAVDPAPKPTAYERSKQAAEREAERVAERGLDVVYLNPAAVYGPSPTPTTLNGFFRRLLAGEIPVLPPGGVTLAFIDGVVSAHLAAADVGRPGERYLLGDEYLDLSELARRTLALAGSARSTPRVAPAWLLGAFARASAPLARAFGLTPLVAPGELSFLLWRARVDASKAQRELGFRPTPADEGIRRTLEAFERER